MAGTKINGYNGDILAIERGWIDTDADAGEVDGVGVGLATLAPFATMPNGSICTSIATGHRWVKNSTGAWIRSDDTGAAGKEDKGKMTIGGTAYTVSKEAWTFTLSDNTTVTKNVLLV